jgi:hypothetical protein
MNFLLYTRETERSLWQVHLQQREHNALIQENTPYTDLQTAPYTNCSLKWRLMSSAILSSKPLVIIWTSRWYYWSICYITETHSKRGIFCTPRDILYSFIIRVLVHCGLVYHNSSSRNIYATLYCTTRYGIVSLRSKWFLFVLWYSDD